MESRGKLDNDEKVKFVGPRKSVRLREKACGTRDIWKLPKNYGLKINLANKLFLKYQFDQKTINGLILANEQ